MATWAEFATAAPELASQGRDLLYRGGHGQALLATVRGDELPRIHPISLGIVGDRLYAFILRSAKRLDLEQDGRFALHTLQDPAAPSEFAVRGRATIVDAEDVRCGGGAGLVVRRRRDLRAIRVFDRGRAPWRARRTRRVATALHVVVGRPRAARVRTPPLIVSCATTRGPLRSARRTGRPATRAIVSPITSSGRSSSFLKRMQDLPMSSFLPVLAHARGTSARSPGRRRRISCRATCSSSATPAQQTPAAARCTCRGSAVRHVVADHAVLHALLDIPWAGSRG